MIFKINWIFIIQLENVNRFTRWNFHIQFLLKKNLIGINSIKQCFFLIIILNGWFLLLLMSHDGFWKKKIFLFVHNWNSSLFKPILLIFFIYLHTIHLYELTYKINYKLTFFKNLIFVFKISIISLNVGLLYTDFDF